MLGLSQFLGKEIIAGVDIGSRFIKVVQGEPNGAGRWRIIRAAIAPTPPDSVRDGIVTDPGAVGTAIRELFRTGNIEANSAIAAISGGSVIVRHVKLPRMPENVLRKSVRFEAGKYISSSMDDSLVEFEIVGEVPGEDDKMGVMLVAAPNDMVESRLTALAAAGLEPIAVDVEAFALQRALLDLSATRPGEGVTLALLNIGAVTTDVNIVADGRSALTRNIDIAGDRFTTALKAASRQTEWHELEALKRNVNMAALLNPDADAGEAALARAVQPVLDELLRDVRRSMNYYQSQLSDPNSSLPAGITAETGGGSVSKIVVSGGSARLQGLESYVAARLGVPVEAWNVFDNPSFDTVSLAPGFLDENYPLLTTGVGLALKEMAGTAQADKPSSSRGAKLAQAA